jgi:hypothetical protein
MTGVHMIWRLSMSDGTALSSPDLEGEARAQAIAAMAQRMAAVRQRMRRKAPEPAVAPKDAPGDAPADAPVEFLSMRFVDPPAAAPDPYEERVFAPAVDAEAAWPRDAAPRAQRAKLDLSPWKEELAWAGRIALMGAMGACGFGLVVLAEHAAHAPARPKYDVAAPGAAPARPDLAASGTARAGAVDAAASQQWRPLMAENTNVAPHEAAVHRMPVHHAPAAAAGARAAADKPRPAHAAPVAVAKAEARRRVEPHVATRSFDLPRWVTAPQASRPAAKPKAAAVQVARVMSPPPHDLEVPQAVAANTAGSDASVQAAPAPAELSASAYPVRPPFDPPAPFRYGEPPGGPPYYGYAYGGPPNY